MSVILRIVLLVALAITGAQFAAASPELWRAEGWKTDFNKALVPLAEILSGGPGRDGIPAIDRPKFEAAKTVSRYGEQEPVIVLEDGGKARAYPLSILTWHEIVNDVMGTRPVAVTYCPLCNASVVFDRRLDGHVLDFGTTGNLRNSDLVMYDRQTETWWQQFTGEGIVGELAGKTLKMIPSRVVPFSEFRARHPEGLVLVPTNPEMRDYGRNPYVNYDSRSAPYPLFQGQLPQGIDPMERVVVVRHGDAITAAALGYLRQQGRIVVNGIELKWSSGMSSALDHAQIVRGRDIGAVEVTDEKSGRPLVHDVTFAFVLFAFHPEVPVLTSKGALALKSRP